MLFVCPYGEFRANLSCRDFFAQVSSTRKIGPARGDVNFGYLIFATKSLALHTSKSTRMLCNIIQDSGKIPLVSKGVLCVGAVAMADYGKDYAQLACSGLVLFETYEGPTQGVFFFFSVDFTTWSDFMSYSSSSLISFPIEMCDGCDNLR